MISNLVLTVDKDVANANITVDWDINWSKFDQLTNLSYGEVWKIVGIDGVLNTTLFVGPNLVNGVSSNGNLTTHRTKVATIPLSDLDEDTTTDDDLAAVVTLTPQLPTTRTAQSGDGPCFGPLVEIPESSSRWRGSEIPSRAGRSSSFRETISKLSPEPRQADGTPSLWSTGMSRRWVILGVGGFVAVALAVVLALFQPWKLWVDDTVDQVAPTGAVPITASAPDDHPTRPLPRRRQRPPSPPGNTRPRCRGRDLDHTNTHDPVPPRPRCHPVAGRRRVRLHRPRHHGRRRAAPGSHRRRCSSGFEALDTSNGPDLFVYLSTNPPDGPEGALRR